MKTSEYIYDDASRKIEAGRLALLNRLHNPKTLSYIAPMLQGCKRILEIGCGSGALAEEVVKLTDSSTQYLGVDRDQAQVKHTQELLNKYGVRAQTMQLDLLNEEDFLALKQKGPFDLIYCRWVLVHIPTKMRVKLLENMISLLSEDGMFLCDECDNRSVKFQAIAGRKSQSPYEEATQIWLDSSEALMNMLEIDLQYTAQKIERDIKEASHSKGTIRLAGKYQVILQGEGKRIIADNFRSGASTILKAWGKETKDFIHIIDECVADDSIEIPFLDESIMIYTKK